MKGLMRVVDEYALDKVHNGVHVFNIFDTTGIMVKDDNYVNGE